MKKARVIEFPEDRPLTQEEYLDYSTHAYNSSSWYATEYSRTSAQVQDKLVRKGYPVGSVEVQTASGEVEFKDIIGDVLERLTDELVLDDERIARSLVTRETSRGRGASHIQQQLRQRGIPQELIETVLEERSDDEEAVIASVDKTANAILRSSAYRKLDNEWEKSNKLTRGLLSKGFSFDDIGLWKEAQE